MEYTATSIQEVIGRVIRNTRLQDAGFISDMNEWIPEAMGQMKTRMVLQKRWEWVPIEFHKGRLPCGLRRILAVEYCGERLRYYNGDRTFTAPSPKKASDQLSLFSTSFVGHDTPEEEQGGFWTDTQLTQVMSMAGCGDSYYTELDWINTSFEDGWVRIFYNALPLDEDGFPLIPDNEHYKQAIYWYCRGQMIGAGFQDRIFSFDACEARFRDHAAKAVAQIRYPSVDQMEARMASQTRLVMPEGWWNSFFGNMSQEGMLG
jgi:hypothetical protein